MRWGTEVLTATYDEGTFGWDVVVRNADGATESMHCDVLLSAVGVLNRPIMPKLPGLEQFGGVSFHSAEWPEDLHLAGKRVAIVGTGASSMQITPAIADTVSELTVFQRSPQWVAPFEKFRKPIRTELRHAVRCVPAVSDVGTGSVCSGSSGTRSSSRCESIRSGTHPERSVNARNDAHRQYFTRYITEQLGNEPETAREGRCPTIHRSASASCSTTAGLRRCAKTTSISSPRA